MSNNKPHTKITSLHLRQEVVEKETKPDERRAIVNLGKMLGSAYLFSHINALLISRSIYMYDLDIVRQHLHIE